MNPIAILTGYGLTDKAAKIVLTLIGAALLIGGVWLALHLYGAHRYNEGVSAADAKWEAAGAKLQADAANSANNADANATARTVNELANQARDQEAVNQAERNGTSALDALFGN
jgi:hypothetical protein